mgnify:CR=1 FL=1
MNGTTELLLVAQFAETLVLALLTYVVNDLRSRIARLEHMHMRGEQARISSAGE